MVELNELADMMLEDIASYRVSDEEFQAVVRWWRVKNNFVPTSKDVLEALAIVRENAKAKALRALPVRAERKEDVFSAEYCESARGKIQSILQQVNNVSPMKRMPRQYRCRA